jgi:hypothetical protein
VHQCFGPGNFTRIRIWTVAESVSKFRPCFFMKKEKFGLKPAFILYEYLCLLNPYERHSGSRKSLQPNRELFKNDFFFPFYLA